MTCPNAENLTAFADGELGAAESAAIDRHLCGCPTCTNFVSDMRLLDALGRSSLRQIRVTTSPPRVRLGRSRLRLAAAIAAVLLLAIGGAGWLMMSHRSAPVTVTIPPPPSPHVAVATTTTAAFSDEEFEQWAAPHRRRRIPLVPMEEVATYRAPVVLPFLPAETSSKPRYQ